MQKYEYKFLFLIPIKAKMFLFQIHWTATRKEKKMCDSHVTFCYATL